MDYMTEGGVTERDKVEGGMKEQLALSDRMVFGRSLRVSGMKSKDLKEAREWELLEFWGEGEGQVQRP